MQCVKCGCLFIGAQWISDSLHAYHIIQTFQRKQLSSCSASVVLLPFASNANRHKASENQPLIFMFSIIMFYYSSVITVVITRVICNKTRRKKPKLVSLIWFFEFLSTPWGHRWGYECRLTGLLHHNRLVHSISVQQLHRSPPLLPFLKHDEILRYLNSTSNSLPTWSGLSNVLHDATSSQKEKKPVLRTPNCILSISPSFSCAIKLQTESVTKGSPSKH